MGPHKLSGTAGENVRITDNNVSLNGASTYYNTELDPPSGGYLWYGNWSTSGNDTGRITLPTTGTYTLKFSPGGTVTGSQTFTIYSIPPDPTYSATPDSGGDSVPTALNYEGQWDLITFSGIAGESIRLTNSGVNLAGTSSYYNTEIDAPSGDYIWYGNWSTSGNDSGLLTLPSTGRYTLKYSPGGTVTGSQTFTLYSIPPGNQQLAQDFMPLLNFSSQEKWRPLNVATFFADNFGSTGIYGPNNQICTAGYVCQAITNPSQLAQYSPASDFLEFDNIAAPGNVSAPDDYRSPDSSCVTGVLLDCDSGSASSIYYTVQGPSPAGLQYIEYWAFYRYNQGYNDIGNHVGDWEGVVVAPTQDDQAIAFVEFSHHGSWDSYLVSGLSCGAASSRCSVASAENDNLDVNDFPASGSHASYPAANSGKSTDGNTDGAAPWGNNLSASALLPLPATATEGVGWTSGPENWTDWPGAWGDTPQSGTPGFTGSPCGPAAASGVAADGACGADHGNHYFEPWGGSDTNTVCKTGPCPDRTRGSGADRSITVSSCRSWFGAGVSASACNPARLARAVRDQDFQSKRTPFRMSLRGEHGQAAAAPGIEQLLGRPLQIGSTLVVTGHIPARTQICVKAEAGGTVVDAHVMIQKRIRGSLFLVVRRARARGLTVVATGPVARVGKTIITKGS